MEFNEVKRLIRRYGVTKWIESGLNVLEVGDKLIGAHGTFSRLDYYNKNCGVKFSEFEFIKCPCGKIELNNGKSIYYRVIMPYEI